MAQTVKNLAQEEAAANCFLRRNLIMSCLF